MKGLFLLVCGMLVLCSCEKYSLSRVYRSQVLNSMGYGRDSLSGAGEARGNDTVVYVSAVTVPDNYDWRRDSSYGSVAGELLLLKNGIPQFSTVAGAGSLIDISPDTHHLMGGHIYTEYTSSDGTVICRDGKPLLRYPQRERLKGFLIKSADIYTLGRSLDGEGFCYRRNGEVLLRQDSGSIFGDFTNTAYGRNGALYMDAGSVCFCFKNSSACYSVRDGVMKEEKTSAGVSRIIEMRILNSTVYYVADYLGTMIVFAPGFNRTLQCNTPVRAASLFLREGEPWIIADADNATICRRVQDAGSASAGVRFAGSSNFIFDAGGRFYSAGVESGTLSIKNEDGEYLFVQDSTYFFGPGSINCIGEQIYALINPRERDRLPALWHGGTGKEYKINGYLTALEVGISPPS